MRSVRDIQGGVNVNTRTGRGSRATASGRKLMVRDIMSESVVTASVDERIVSAARKMSDNHVSCVVVVDNGKLAGILTQKDILRVVACEEGNYGRAKTSEKMSCPVGVVLPTLSVIAAGRIMEANGIKRLPVLVDQRLVGIVTQTDITRGLTFLSPLRSVADIMSTHVATVRTDATVVEGARIMSDNNISCILVMDQEEVAGILTEKDLLDRVVIPRRHPRKTNVSEVMSRPVAWIPPSYSVLGAAQKMDQMHLHRLVVMDRKQLCGLVTQTDIMRAIRRELERADAKCGPGTQDLPSELRDLAGVWHRLPEQVKATIRTLAGDSTGDRSDPAVSSVRPGHL